MWQDETNGSSCSILPILSVCLDLLWSLAKRVLNCIPNFRDERFFCGGVYAFGDNLRVTRLAGLIDARPTPQRQCLSRFDPT